MKVEGWRSEIMTGLRPGEDGAAKVTLVKRKNLELR